MPSAWNARLRSARRSNARWRLRDRPSCTCSSTRRRCEPAGRCFSNRRSPLMPMPLEGIRVIDWTIFQQGPVCTAMLGDLGAEVIKIEEREGGDPGRGVTRISGIDMADRPNFYFEANNRNKRSITLDLKKPAAREIVYQLVAKSDVFVQNFRQGVAAR